VSAPSFSPAAVPSNVVPLISLPAFSEDSLDGLETAITAQCRLAKPPEPWPFLCADLLKQADLKVWLGKRFKAKPLLTADGKPDGLITGYYEPLVTGSRARENPSQAAVFKRPSDLLRTSSIDQVTGAVRDRARLVDGLFNPYFSRAQIENTSVLENQTLFYLDDPIEAFFLHIQGSGRVQLRERDGQVRVVRLAFADHNGHSYKAIGQVLRERNALSPQDITTGTIKEWLRNNPAQRSDVMQANQRYIFFSEIPEGKKEQGPIGSLGVPLTAERSIASDPKTIPPGALLFLSTTDPNNNQPINRVVISQDTGAAITGQVRADYFWGFGDEAGQKAGAMKQPGKLWLLVPVND
jgi:membrane-bound lytic murein transglycosylase A